MHIYKLVNGIKDIDIILNDWAPEKIKAIFVTGNVDDLELIKKVLNILREKYESSVIFGGTTFGNIAKGDKDNVSVVILDSELIDDILLAKIDFEDIDRSIEELKEDIKAKFNEDAIDLDPDRYVGMLVIDNSFNKDEEVVNKVGNIFNIFLIGFSAADNWTFDRMSVFNGDKVEKGKAVLAIFKPKKPVMVFKTQSVKSFGVKGEVTKSNGRVIQEIEWEGKEKMGMLEDVKVVRKLLKCGLIKAKHICECAEKERQGLCYDYIDGDYIIDLLRRQGFNVTLVNREEFIEEVYRGIYVNIVEHYMISKDGFEYEIKTYNGHISPWRILDMARMWAYR